MGRFQQPKEVTHGYFVRAEMMNDFIDYLFDVEQIGDYKEVWKRFKKWEEKSRKNKTSKIINNKE